MGVRLPAEYQEVEWIGSNNDAYLVIKNAVDLPEATNLKVKTTVLWKNVLSRQIHGRNGRCYFGVVDGYYQNTQTGTGHTQIEAVANEWASVEWSRNDSVCTLKVGNDIDITNSTITTTGPMPFALFALGDGSIRCYCALKETQVEIGSEQFDLIPCYRKQDSKPGMYDLASDTFFVNQGSRKFDIGPDVIDSISPWLVARRRMLMQDKIYCPYITDGLIFWLDGICKGTDPTIWKDLIGRKNFALNNCSFTTNGVHFASGSYGEFDGAISNDWSNETIEIAVNTSTTQNCFVLPPYDENGTGIGGIQGNTTNFGFRIDGGDYRKYDWSHGWKTASVNNSYGVRNLASVKRVTTTDYWGANNTGKTYIGRRVPNNSYQFAGIMHCIRIYNRRLSIAEMQANQQIDNIRFNLGL